MNATTEPMLDYTLDIYVIKPTKYCSITGLAIPCKELLEGIDKLKVLNEPLPSDDDVTFYNVLHDFHIKVWPEHESDFRTLSTKHPDLLFALYGTDEEKIFDSWVKYFKNGLMQQEYVQLEYGKFEERRLQ